MGFEGSYWDLKIGQLEKRLYFSGTYTLYMKGGGKLDFAESSSEDYPAAEGWSQFTWSGITFFLLKSTNNKMIAKGISADGTTWDGELGEFRGGHY